MDRTKKPVYLRTRRLALGLTQAELSHAARVPQAVISKLEAMPHARPAFETQMLLAGALKVRATRLRWGPDPHAKQPKRIKLQAAV